MATFIVLSGCSTIDSNRSPIDTHSSVRGLPEIPEIKVPTITTKPVYKKPKKVVVQQASNRSRTAVRSYPKTIVRKEATKQKVSKQKVTKPTATKQSPNKVQNSIPKKESKKVVSSVLPKQTEQQTLANKKRLVQQAQKKATVNIDPYANIPESSSININNNKTIYKRAVQKTANTKSVTSTQLSTSPAVRSLMVSARADISIGKNRSAISKLERGLRIEPRNAELWHMLARGHYANSAYLHAISIAKKSNAYTNNTVLTKKNWTLIKQAGERSGNASAIKEALNYIKLNP